VSASVLVIDKEEPARESCVRILRSLGLETQVADSSACALALLKGGRFDIVLADTRMSAPGEWEFLRIIRHDYPQTEIVLMAAPQTGSPAGQATKLDAYSCLTKPLNVRDLRMLLERLAEKQDREAQSQRVQQWLKPRTELEGLIGAGAAMQKVYGTIVKVAAKLHPVLILGESGTGKELVARAIHSCGPWRDEAFMPVDCGGLPPTLIESELFGHVRGAFTGATQDRRGLLAAAGAGTVFLDEIAELPVELQAKLLRALQEREIKPIGSNQRTPLEARIVAATNQDLEAAIKRGSFRKDLYFRLNIVRIKLPPLRERKEDIPALVQYFIAKYRGAGDAATGISPQAMSRMMNYEWPGNVRELENCIQRALALGAGPEICVEDLPSNLLYNIPSGASTREIKTLRELERRAILQALETTRGDRLRAAKLLGISKTTVYRKLKEYGLGDASGDLSSS
jgi:two-component system response regulator HydG